jgi:beta-lactamase superfamily II metal-dependent hydrolase
LLSSFIKISTDDWHILLPSDILKSTIERINNKYRERLDNRLVVSQIPHHGSEHSHYEAFWEGIPHKERIPVFVSVGLKYDLPSKEVIKFFDENYKEIHSTNYVGGFKEYFEDKYDNRNTRSIGYLTDKYLNSFKDQELLSNGCGEKQIKIEEDGTCAIITNLETVLL